MPPLWSAISALLLVSGLALVPSALAGSGEAGWMWQALHRYLTLVAVVPSPATCTWPSFDPPTRPSLSGIIDGHVDAGWAARHHPRWPAQRSQDP